jgi:hypothetical protein
MRHHPQSELTRGGGSAPPLSGTGASRDELRAGEALYREFNRFEPRAVITVRHSRLIPPVVVELGQLAGLIYRSDKWQRGQPRRYIHFFEEPPRLVSSLDGSQLYVIGGNYQVTQDGIEG